MCQSELPTESTRRGQAASWRRSVDLAGLMFGKLDSHCAESTVKSVSLAYPMGSRVEEGAAWHRHCSVPL